MLTAAPLFEQTKLSRKLLRALLIVSVAFLATSAVQPSGTKTWTGATSPDWTDGNNWAPSGIPSATDDILISSALTNQPILRGDTTVRNLQVTGGGALYLGGYHLTVTGDLTSVLGTGPLIESGILWQSPTDRVTVVGKATFGSPLGALVPENNFLAGELRLKGDFSQVADLDAPPQAFAATGTKVIFEGTAQQRVFFATPGQNQSHFQDVQFANPGGVLIASDTVVNGDFTNSGYLILPSGKSLGVNGASAVNTGIFQGTGSLQIVEGVFTNEGDLKPGEPTGRLNIFGAFTQTSTGTTHIDVGGTSSMQRDEVSISGDTALDGTLAVHLINGYVPNVGDTFNIIQFLSGSGDFADKTGLDIGNGKVFIASRESIGITLRAGAEAGAAFWIKSGGGNWSDPYAWSTMTVPDPATKVYIDLDGDYTVNLDTDTVVGDLILGSTGTGTQVLDNPSHQLVINNAGLIRRNGSYMQSGGKISGNQALNVEGSFQWSGGEMMGSGRTHITPTGVLNLRGSVDKRLANGQSTSGGRRLENEGNILWSGTGRLMMGDGAAIENMADGVFEIATDSALYYYRGDPCTFKNGPNARFIRSGGSGALAVYLVAFTNEGFVELLTGLLDFGAGAYLQTNGATLLRGGEIKSSSLIDIRGGTLEGYGTVIGNVLSSSHVSPGYPGSTTIPQAPPGRRPAGSPPEPGILTINGNYTQTSTGVLRLNILGNTPGTQHDQLVVTNTATLDGTLSVAADPPFVPVLDGTVDAMLFGMHTGIFTTLDLPDLGSGLSFTPVYSTPKLQLKVRQDLPDLLIKRGDEPEPQFQIPGVYQTTPADGQVEVQQPTPTVRATYHVKLVNDGALRRSYTIRARESGEAGWTVAYKKPDDAAVPAEITSPAGTISPDIDPGQSLILTIEMTPNAVVPAGTGKSVIIESLLNPSDGVVRDAVEARAKVDAGPRDRLAFVVQPPDGTVGSPLAPPVEVAIQDAFGNVITDATDSVTLLLRSTGGTGTLVGTPTVAAVNGVAKFNDLVIREPGSGYTLEATAAGVTAATSSPFSISGGTPAKLAFAVNPTNTTAGDPFNPSVTVRVEDASGNIVSTAGDSITLSFDNNPSGASLEGTRTLTTTDGIATFSDLKVTKAGTGYTLKAVSGALTAAISMPFDIAAAPAVRVVFDTQPSNTTAGAAITPPVSVAFHDAYGNPTSFSLGSITLTIASNPGRGTLSGQTMAPAVGTSLAFPDLSIDKAGTGYRLRATGDDILPATSDAFDITPDIAAQLGFAVQPASGVAGTPLKPVKVVVRDRFGNRVPTATPEISLALAADPPARALAGTTTVTAANGEAVFDNLLMDQAGTGFTLVATATGSGTLAPATSVPFNMAPADAAQLVFTVDPSDTVSGVAIEPAVKVAVHDRFANLVKAGQYTVALALGANPPSGTLSGTLTALTYNGMATFTNLKVDKAGAGYTLEATADGLNQGTSKPFAVSAGRPMRLAFRVQPTSTEAGAVIAPAVSVILQDAAGNPVIAGNNEITLSLGANPAEGLLSGTRTVAAINGMATFADLSINRSGIGYVLRAASTGLFAASSDAFNIRPGAAARMRFTVPPTNTVAGKAITPPVQITAYDALGNVATGTDTAVTLAFGRNPGGGTLTGTTTVSFVEGVATFPDLSVDKAGIGYSLTASTAADLPGVSSPLFNVVPAPPARLVFAAPPANTVAGAPITPGVKVAVVDAFGNPVPDATPEVTIALGENPGGALLTGATVVRAANGVAEFTDLRLDKAGKGYTLAASATDLSGSGSAAFDVLPAAAHRLVFVVEPTNATAGAAITPPVRVVVHDAFGNPVPAGRYAITMALGQNPAGGTLSGTTAVTSLLGGATFSNLKLDKAGAGYSLTASAPGLTAANSTVFAVAAGAPARLAFGVQPSTTAAGATIAPPVTVEIRDATGNLVPDTGTAVTIALGSGPAGALLGGTLTAAAANGVATFANLSLDRAASGYTLRATAAELPAATSAAFDITPGQAHRLVFVAQPPPAIAGAPLTPGPKVEIQDRFGNTAATTGLEITLAIAAGSGTAGAVLSGTTSVGATDGIARFPNLSIDRAGAGYRLAASAASLTPATSAPFTVSPAAAARLAFVVQPSNTASGVAINPAVQVAVLDAFGNPVSAVTHAVTVALGNNPVEGNLTGTLTANTSGGIATFANLRMDKAGTGYTLKASSGNLNPAASAGFDVSAGRPIQLAFVAQPTDTIAGSPITPPGVKVHLRDAAGNLVLDAGNSVTLSIAEGPEGAVLSGTRTVAAQNGVAIFSDISLNRAGTGYVLRAGATGIFAAISDPFSIRPAAPARLLFTAQPSQTAAGAPISPAVQVTAHDAFGNVATGTPVPVTLALGRNPTDATLAGATTANTVNGVATFADLSIQKAGVGYTLMASAPDATGATSAAFDLTPTAAVRLAFLSEPTDADAGAALSPAVRVVVLDALGNRVLAGAPEITVALGANPAGGTLRGATAVLAVNGISTFANLSLARAGVGYTLTASAPGLAGATSVPFAIAPVAPARLVFQEQPTNTLAGAAIAPAVRVGVVDRFGNAVTTAAPDVTIALGSNPGGSTFSPAVVRAVNGVATFTDLRLDKAGTGYRLAASAPDLLGAASTAFDVAPAAAKRLVFTTQPANTPSGAPVSPAIAVSVWDGLGNLVTDGSHSVTLALGANPAGGTLSGTLTAATSRGVATFANVRLDKAGAGYTLVASANGLVGSESAPFDVRAGQAASLRFRVQPGSVEAGAAITPAVMVMVLDAAGNLVTDTTATVAIAIAAGPSDALSGATSATAINGLASFADLSLRKAGTGYALKASAPGVAAVVSDTFDVTPAAPARLVFAGQPGNTAAGAAITPAVKVVALDRFDNVASAAGAFVTLALGANPGDGTLTGATTAAVVDGAAIFADLRIDRAAAGYTLAASSSGLAGATSAPFDIVPASGQRLAFLIRPVSSTAGAAITPAVEVGVLDLFGNLVTTATTEITLRLNDNPSGGTLSGTTTVRALNGIATFADLSVDKAGAGYTLHAGATGLGGAVSTAFDISPAAAAKLAFDVQPSSTPSGVAIAPAVKVVVQDAFGNAVTAGRYSITMALETNPAGGTLWGTTALSSTLGAAAFANLKIDNAGVGYTLKATAPGLVPAISKAFAVTFGRAYRLAFVTQPGTTTAGVPFSPALTVEVRDSAGNRVTEGTTPVTMGIGFNSNGGTLSGTANVNTANGIATFADLSLDKEGYRYTLKATAAGLIAATSDEFYVKSGPATRLVFGTQPTDTAAGMPIAPGFGTLAVDRFGNIDRGFEGVVNIAIAANPVGGTLLGTTSSRSMTGSAPFGDLSIRQAGAGYTFVASSEGLTSVTSAAFDITPGPAKVLVILTQPSDATAGAAIAPAVRVQAQDEYTNPVTTARLSVAAVLVDNPGEARLLGATTTSTAGGIATFSSLALDKVGAGYTLQFSAPGLNPVTSAPFAVTPGADAKLAFAAQPGTVVAGAAVAPTPKVVVLDRFNNVTGSAARISIALGANPAGGALIGASTVTAVDGAATFPDLHINKAGRGYTLAASTEGLAGAVSNAFAVLPGPAAALAFTVQPANATSGAAITPAVQVAVVDRFGNLLPAARHSVALALGANPAGGTLSGGTTAAAAQGVATFADVRVDKAGSGYTLTASAAGLTAATSTAFDVAAGTATRLAFRAQPTDGTAGAPLAPAITVVTLDAAGNPAPATGRVTLSLGANPGSGTLAGALTASLVNGVATFADLSLDKAGTGYTFAATATGLESATSAPFAIKAAAPAALEFVAQPSNSTAGAAIAPPLKVAVLDRFGNRATAPETTITLALGSNPSGGTLSGTATQIARDGSAGFTDLSIDKAGKGYTLTASAPGLTGATSVAFDVAADRAARLLFSTQPGPAVAGAPFAPAPRVTAEDRLGNAVPITGAVTVALGANPAGGALSGPTSVAPKDGVVLLANLSIQKAGNGYTLVVSAADLPAVASAAFDVSAAGPARLEFLAQPTATAAGAPLKPAPKVGLLDAFGNRAPVALDVTLALGAAPAGGSLSGTATVRTSDGVAEFADLSIDKAGAGYTLAASAADVAGATSAPFPITPGAAARLTFVVQPAATPSAAAITPAVKVSVLDRLGNVVTAGRIPVTLALDANPSAGTLYGTTRTYTAQGTALFSNLRVDRAGQGYTLKAEATGMTAATSAAFDVTSGRAFRVAFLTQPGTATAGAPIPAAGIAAAPGSARPTAAAGISVEVLDGAGNRVAGDTSITLVIRSNPAGGTLSGTTTATAVNGVATFPDVKIDKAGDGYTLKAVAEGLATATSAAFSVNPGAPARLVFAAQPASAPAGAAIAPAVRVAVQDAFGNAVLATPEITLALGANPAGGTLAGAVTARAAAGVATFADLSISKAGAGYTLAASAEGLAGATSSAFNITPDAATRLEFVAQPASTTAGAALAPVKVALVDRFGNVATTAAGSVTLALGANPAGGTLAGRVTVRAAAGVATFDALSIAKAGTGYTLEASSGGLAGATSGAFAISPAAAAKLLFHVQPADTASRAAIEPAVQVAVQDAFGNLVTTGRHTVTVALGANPSEGTLSGTATATTAAGVATFANLRVDRAGADYTLTASADGLASATSAPFDVTAGQAFRLVFAVQPRATTAGAAIAPAVVVQAVDAAGNRVSSNADITVAIRNSPAGGTLSGGTTIGAMGGAATFGNLTINRAGAGYTLKATATGLATATSAAFDVAPGPAAKMAFTVQPSDTTAGEALVPAVEVSVQDALGNLVPDAAGEVALALAQNPAGGALAGARTARLAGGKATFTSLSLDKAGSGYALGATFSGMSATSAAFDVAAGPAARLAFAAEPQAAAEGVLITPPVRIAVQDEFGNAVLARTRVTLALQGGPAGAALSGTTAADAVRGVATFSDLRINRAGSGYTLVASAPELAGATTAPFAVASTLKPDLLIKQGTGAAPYAIDNVYQPDEPAGAQIVGLESVPAGTAVFQVRVQNDGNTPAHFILRRTSAALAGGWAFTATAAGADITDALGQDAGYRTGLLAPRAAETLLLKVTPGTSLEDGSAAAVDLAAFVEGAGTAGDRVRAVTTVHGVAVQGRLTTSDGRPLPAQTVVELLSRRTVVASTVADAGGAYRLSVAPGTYDLQARAAGYVPLLVPDLDVAGTGEGSGAVTVNLLLPPQPDFGAGTNLVTFPFEFEQGKVESVVGDPDALYQWLDPATGRYRTSGTHVMPAAVPGRGFWLKQKRGYPADGYQIVQPGVMPAQNRAFILPLDLGWQIIGNPFATGDIQLSQIKVLMPGSLNPVPLTAVPNAVHDYLWGWNGTKYELVSAEAEGETTTLRAYKGYLFNALIRGVRLYIEQPAAGAAAASAQRKRSLNKDEWRVRLVATAGSQAGVASILGVGGRAYTLEAPPAQGSLEVAVVSRAGSRAAVDVRTGSAGALVWNLEVAGGQDGQEVTLTWPDLGGVPRDTRLVLVDEATGQRRQMRTTGAHSFRANGAPRRFRVEAERSAGALLAVTGIEVTASRGAGRAIAYTLSADAAASVEIVSPSGRIVRRVSAAQAAARGRNQAYWDGRDDRGVTIPSGLVLVRITATTEDGAAVQAVRPVVLVR